jgi:NhaP-type Na+/H+ or K+/H+ antiporter
VYLDIVILALFTFFYSTVAGAIERTWISGPIAMTVVCTIIFSIIAHGVSANPWARVLGERSQRIQGGASAGD